MASRKSWAGAPTWITDPPSAPAVREKRDHPEVWVNGKHYAWEPGHESDVPPEALAVWRAYLEANP